MTTFGAHLRHERLRAGLGLRELARRMKSSASYLSRLETGDESNPPSEDWIWRWQRYTLADIDVTLALSGRIPKWLLAFLSENPAVQDFLREMHFANLSASDWRKLAKEAKR